MRRRVLGSWAEVAMGIEELRESSYWSESEGQRAVALWRASGESLGAFARRTGLRRSRMAYWASHSRSSTAVALATVTVLPSRRTSSLTIELRSGRSIRVAGDFDDALLERAIAVAERGPC